MHEANPSWFAKASGLHSLARNDIPTQHPALIAASGRSTPRTSRKSGNSCARRDRRRRREAVLAPRATRAPSPSPAERQHRQRAVGFEIRHAAMDDGVGVGIVGIDAERLRQPRAVAGLDRGETKPPLLRRAPRRSGPSASRTRRRRRRGSRHRPAMALARAVIAFSRAVPRDRLQRTLQFRSGDLHAGLGFRQPVTLAAGRRQHAKVDLVAAGAKRVGELPRQAGEK